MTDRVSPEVRSRIMASVKGKNTGPELIVRSMAHALGFRFRLHRADLPGRPDLVFPRRRKVVFVHGCFWHGHACKREKMPKSNEAFWTAKVTTNQARDGRARRELRALGWSSLVLWECETKQAEKLERKLVAFLATD
jgi:DNA mismatch endonuclease (patch repair protein)